MKKIILSSFLVFSTFAAFAQSAEDSFALLSAVMGNDQQTSAKYDTLVTMKGEVVICKDLTFNHSEAVFTKTGEQAKTTMPASNILSINSKPFREDISTIVTANGSMIECFITGKDSKAVRFKQAGSEAEMSIPVSSVQYITYPNGETEHFSGNAGPGTYNTLASSGLATGTVEYSNRGSGRLYLDGEPISSAKYREMCLAIDENIWRQYRSGTSLRTAGAVLLGVGGGMLGFSIIFGISGASTLNEILIMGSYTTLAVGLPMMIAGIPVYCVGKSKRRRSVNNYNQAVKELANPVATLNFGISDAGIGFALNF